METILIILVSFLSFLILILLVVIAFFMYKFLKLKENSPSDNSDLQVHKTHSKNISKELQNAKDAQDMAGERFCSDHPEVVATGVCAISDRFYCQACLLKEGDVKLSRKYLNLYLDASWETLFFLNDNEIGPEVLSHLTHVKQRVWKEEKLPIITQKQFKINIEDDSIESFTMISVRDIDQKYIMKKLNFLETKGNM